MNTDNKSHIRELLSLQNDINIYINSEIALSLVNGQSSNQQVRDHIKLLLEDALTDNNYTMNERT